jgi:hypothetical protein
VSALTLISPCITLFGSAIPICQLKLALQLPCEYVDTDFTLYYTLCPTVARDWVNAFNKNCYDKYASLAAQNSTPGGALLQVTDIATIDDVGGESLMSYTA